MRGYCGISLVAHADKIRLKIVATSLKRLRGEGTAVGGAVQVSPDDGYDVRGAQAARVRKKSSCFFALLQDPVIHRPAEG